MDKKYCIFDMDGTLTDSMHDWKALGRDYLVSKGAEPDETLLWMVKTMTMIESAAYFMDAFGIEGPPERIVEEMQAVMAERYRSDIPLKPGVRAYLAALKAQGARLCVATATAEPLARSCFRRLGIEDCFDAVISCETLGVGKDRPDVFLAAAGRMGADPADCAVFEDALFAAGTAKRAGFYTVGVREPSYAGDWEQMRALCDETTETFSDLLPAPSQRLYDSARAIWDGYHSHPFVTGIGDGTLDVEKFKYFLLQDYLYLYDYAKVFALGVVKAEEPALMRRFAGSVSAILDGEMEIHRAYMARLGISQAQVDAARKSLANASYTSYMLSVAFSGGPAEIVAAILACSWSYAEIGRRLAARPGAAEHPLYGSWITGYASEDYAAENRALISLINDLAAGYPETGYRRLEEIFVSCSRYEAGFWDMAWRMEN